MKYCKMQQTSVIQWNCVIKSDMQKDQVERRFIQKKRNINIPGDIYDSEGKIYFRLAHVVGNN
jgi:hypothetical protein